MKTVFENKMSLLVLFFTIFVSSQSWANTFRQDLGFYQSSQIWFGDDLRDFADLDNTSSEGSVSTMYAASTFAFEMEKNSEFRFHFRLASASMNGFSAGGAVDGETVTGLADVGFGYSSLLTRWKTHAVHWSVDFSTPGDTNLSPYKFNAITDGQSKYKVGIDYSMTYGIGSIGVGLSYTLRPGSASIINIDDGGNKSEFLFDIPDIVGLDISLPFYFGGRYAGFLLNHEQSLSGVDIGTPDFGLGGGAGRPPFPATREIRTFAGVIFGMVIGTDSSFDVTINGQIYGRNTDKGAGINLGYSLSFE